MQITEKQRAEWVDKYGPDLGHWYNSEGRCDSCDCRWGGGWSKTPCQYVSPDEAAYVEPAVPLRVSVALYAEIQRVG